MATLDYQRFQSLLLNLAGALPAELEEEMYRSRNVRLAEDGFLSFRRCPVSLYAYLRPRLPGRSLPPGRRRMSAADRENTPFVPMIPFHQVEGQNLLTRAAEGIAGCSDPGPASPGVRRPVQSAPLSRPGSGQSIFRSCSGPAAKRPDT